jgi:AcrR family transcriptional regulator
VTEPTRERQRAIARHAGVSHGAPLRHFPSLAALLAAMAASGFARLVATIDAALAGVTGAGPVPAWPRPAGPTSPSPWPSRACSRWTWSPTTAQAAGWHHDRNTDDLAGVLWSHVHGLATLALHGACPPCRPASPSARRSTTPTSMSGPANRPRRPGGGTE